MLKRIIVLGVALVMCLGILSGCGGNGKSISEKPFYSLQAAYENNWLTKSELKSIKNFHDKGNESTLDEEIENDIKTEYLNRYPQDGMTLNDVVINKYYGTYKDCIAITIGYVNSRYTDALWSETVGGVKFQYSNGQRILIFKINN